jgi:cbb3-type cytochrome oxidase maturation protein
LNVRTHRVVGGVEWWVVEIPKGGPGVTATDVAVLLTVIGSVTLFGGAAVLALGWAFRSGQFEDFQRGAVSIFDADEPVGEMTDGFPGERDRKPGDEWPGADEREEA